MDTIEELLEFLIKKTHIYIFGAGIVASRVALVLNKNGIAYDGYLVTSCEGNPNEIDGKPVFSMEESAGKETVKNEDTAVIVALAKQPKEVLTELIDVGIMGAVFLKPALQLKIRYVFEKETLEASQQEFKFDYNGPKQETNQIRVLDAVSGQPLFRTCPLAGKDFIQNFLKQCKKEKGRRFFGDMQYIPNNGEFSISRDASERYSISCYTITTHLDDAKPSDIEASGGIPLQAGAALTEIRKGCLTDDNGESISGKNPNYCEATALYWIWKNTSGQRYVGMNQYRRRLMLSDDSIEYISKNDVDVVTSLPEYTTKKVKDFFLNYISDTDWKMMREGICILDPSYEEIFDEYEEGNLYIPCNVFLMKRERFDSFCEFAFHVAAYVDEEYRRLRIVRKDRYMGYLFENLLSLYFIKNHERLNHVFSEIEWVDPKQNGG